MLSRQELQQTIEECDEIIKLAKGFGDLFKPLILRTQEIRHRAEVALDLIAKGYVPNA